MRTKSSKYIYKGHFGFKWFFIGKVNPTNNSTILPQKPEWGNLWCPALIKKAITM
jgi:hypothetical protein